MATAAATFFLCFFLLTVSILFADVVAYRRVGPLHTPKIEIGEAKDGAVAKLVGTVRLAEDTVCAPVSGRTCAGYEVRVHRKRRVGWEPVKVTRARVGFYLRDHSGEVFVPLDENASVQLCTSARSHRARLRARVRVLLGELHGQAPADRYRFDEGSLTEGSRVAVYGVLRQRPDPRPENVDAYRSSTFHYVLEPAKEGLYVSDDRAAFG